MSNNIAKYIRAGKPLSTREQLAVILSIDYCLSSGLPIVEVIERLRSFEANDVKRNLLNNVKTDIQNDVPFHEVMVKTGFFDAEVEDILLAVQNPEQALKASIRFINLVYN
jgi:type II secretory pathway component PulF